MGFIIKTWLKFRNETKEEEGTGEGEGWRGVASVCLSVRVCVKDPLFSCVFYFYFQVLHNRVVIVIHTKGFFRPQPCLCHDYESLNSDTVVSTQTLFYEGWWFLLRSFVGHRGTRATQDRHKSLGKREVRVFVKYFLFVLTFVVVTNYQGRQ